MTHVPANPYPWPFDGDLRRETTALIVIDMQSDFCGRGGYIDLLGYDISLTRACIEPIQRVLAALRSQGFPIFHTREGHRTDLSDLPANKRWRSRRTPSGVGIGDVGPRGRVLVRGEPGWDIIPELAPLEGEPIIDKPGRALSVPLISSSSFACVESGISSSLELQRTYAFIRPCAKATIEDSNVFSCKTAVLRRTAAITRPPSKW